MHVNSLSIVYMKSARVFICEYLVLSFMLLILTCLLCFEFQ